MWLQHGSTISGTARFDDENPVVGAPVALLCRDATGAWSFAAATGGSGPVFTNDVGEYRITGLLPGKCLVQVTLQTGAWQTMQSTTGSSTNSSNAGQTSISFLSPATISRTDARIVEILPERDIPGVDITIPASRLHTVRGRLVAQGTSHVINAGSVSLQSPGDPGLIAIVSVSSDASFVFPFVPEGELTLTVYGAQDVTRSEVPTCAGCFPATRTEETVLKKYGVTFQPIKITGDRSDLVVDIPPAAQP